MISRFNSLPYLKWEQSQEILIIANHGELRAESDSAQSIGSDSFEWNVRWYYVSHYGFKIG